MCRQRNLVIHCSQVWQNCPPAHQCNSASPSPLQDLGLDTSWEADNNSFFLLHTSFLADLAVPLIIYPPPHLRAVSPVSALPSQTSPQGEPSSSWDCHITAQVAGWLVNHTWEKLWVLVLKGYTTICRA